MASYDAVWEGVGFAGQLIFTSRFLVQWAASEKKKDSVVPVAFWWISLLGGVTLLAYALYIQSRPIIFGQALGLLVYVRNLMLVNKARRRALKQAKRLEAQPRAEADPSPSVAPGLHHRVDMPVRRGAAE